MTFRISNLVPASVSRMVARHALVASKNSPTILFGVGVVGVVATTVLASRATLKLEDVLVPAQENLNTAKELYESGHMDYSQSDYIHDVTLVRVRTAISIAKLYAVPLAVGAISIGCLGGSHHILSKRNFALTAAYATLEKGFREYQQRVIDEFGEEKDREIRFNSKTDWTKTKDEKGKTQVEYHEAPTKTSIYARFFGQDTSVNWDPKPEYNFLFLRSQQAYCNDVLQSRGHIFLNEVYDCLGLERRPEGQIVGWVRGEGDDFVDFGIFGESNVEGFYNFVTGQEGEILLDFNVDGNIWDKI